MRIRITKGSEKDHIEVIRHDGSIETTTFPKKGLLPHDVVHLVVESKLQFETGFWGRVADGANPEDVGAVAIAGGHRSSSRAQTPREDIVELIQAERIVECFEAEMWSEASDLDNFIGVLGAACSQSHVRSPELSAQNLSDIRKELSTLLVRWQKLEKGGSLTLDWK